jgi:hypothetical protein
MRKQEILSMGVVMVLILKCPPKVNVLKEWFLGVGTLGNDRT